ncbi:hypothetical protein NPIL_577521 [Nephila pilipes]|uniref:Uncharacterized protein n=1 Tax=Nephila pilipes TaxID=299642 RepID=A0A8X6R0W8_NEPPI|nr:hypothetical protein NPIL_577521 [Nephila pilipes]
MVIKILFDKAEIRSRYARLPSEAGAQASNPPGGIPSYFPQDSPSWAHISDPFGWIEQHMNSANYDLMDFVYVDSDSDDSDFNNIH